MTMQVREEGQPRRHHRRHRGARHRGPVRPSRRVRRGRDPPRPQLLRQLLPQPADQPARRRVRRLAGEPRQGGAQRGDGGAARGRDTGAGTPIAVTAKLNMADGVRRRHLGRRSRCRRRNGCRTTAVSTPSNSLRAARWSTRCTLFRGDAPVKESPARSAAVAVGHRMTGKKFLREYPYREAYLLQRCQPVPRRADDAAGSCWAASPTARPWIWRWPRDSTSSRWDEPCSPNPT